MLPRTDQTTLLALDVRAATDMRSSSYLSAVTCLEEVVRRTAARVASLGPMQLRRDFLADALSIIFNRLSRFDAARSSFRSWCYMVLRGRWIERVRRWRRERQRFIPWNPVVHEPALLAEVRAVALPAEGEWLPQDDLKHINRWWRPLDRILLLCLSGLWPRVPLPWGERWLNEAGIDRPVPAAALWTERNLGACCATLAGLLRRGPQALLRRWFRRRQQLCELACVRACLEAVA